MKVRRTLVAVSGAALGVGLAVVAPPASAAGPAPHVVRVVMHDDCDRATFNATIGKGTCVGDGTTTFPDFIGQVAATGRAEGWAFRPGEVTVDLDDALRAVNTGGELHTFTRVRAFGGGCIDQLNKLLHLTAVPECGQMVVQDGKRVPKFSATAVPPGGRLQRPVGDAGTHLYQCLIHPWMRTVVHVTAGGDSAP